jgi:hypothetical protein
MLCRQPRLLFAMGLAMLSLLVPGIGNQIPSQPVTEEPISPLVHVLLLRNVFLFLVSLMTMGARLFDTHNLTLLFQAFSLFFHPSNGLQPSRRF